MCTTSLPLLRAPHQAQIGMWTQLDSEVAGLEGFQADVVDDESVQLMLRKGLSSTWVVGYSMVQRATSSRLELHMFFFSCTSTVSP